jgi:DsbC/DsbD-like thiol-disulfide interchange protein/cytochrome c biogenesis protein CcdA
VGLRIQHQPHWHTYWRNPGESGLPTTLEWTLPSGVTVSDIAWPTPKRIPTGGLVNFGYEDDMVLPVRVFVPTAQTTPLQLQAKATWLICKDVCIPEEGVVSLTLPISANATAPSATKSLFDVAFAKQPKSFAGNASAQRSGNEVVYTFDRAALGNAALGNAYVFPFTEGIVEPSAPQRVFADDKQIAIKTKLAANAPAGIPAGLVAVGDAAFEFKLASANTVAAISLPESMKALAGAPEKTSVETLAGAGDDLTLWSAIAFAFLGGMVLNLMPCVFPVLSIKILGFAQHARDDKAAMRAHGVAYSAGVVLSFLSLAALLLAVRAAGSNVGWGFQLQNPIVVGVLAIVFLLIGLNLLGVFELRVAPNVDVAQSKRPLVNAFSSGVLAVVAASPCTAPLMGAALGFALTQSPIFSLAIFAALGVGMALPYALLAWFPAWLKKLPRPGPWMNTMKKWLSLPMFATVAWLGWVLWLQLAPQATNTASLVPTAQAQGVAGSAWKPWSPQAVQDEVAAGRVVFVDYTAAWCVSCQANKKLVLETNAIGQAFADKKVVLMRADWTKKDPAITQSLAALGRSGVPVYVLHRPGKNPLVLPEILTSNTVKEALATI